MAGTATPDPPAADGPVPTRDPAASRKNQTVSRAGHGTAQNIAIDAADTSNRIWLIGHRVDRASKLVRVPTRSNGHPN
jgi:hypothetical protein